MLISNLWILFQIILWSSWLLSFSLSVVFNSLRPRGLEYIRLSCPSPSLLKLMSTELVMSSNHLNLCHPLLLLSSTFPSIKVFSNESALHIRWLNYWEFQLQHHSLQRNPRADLLQNGLVGSPCSPRDSQASSPTPQFQSINSLALSLLHSPTLTSIHDHRKNHSLD